MKKFSKIIIFMCAFIIGNYGVFAAENDYSLKCNGVSLDPTNSEIKNVSCILFIDNSSKHIEETDSINVEIQYNESSRNNDFVLDNTNYEVFKDAITKNENGGTFRLTMGAIPQSKFEAVEITLKQSLTHSGASLTVFDGDLKYSMKIDNELANTIDFLFTNKILKPSSPNIHYLRPDYETFSSDYILTNNTTGNGDGILSGMTGYIDVANLPQGIKLDGARLDDNRGDEATAITLNKDTGQWVVDFDLSANGIKYQKENDIKITFDYKITDSTKIPDRFQTTLIVDRYINNVMPDNALKPDNPITTIYEMSYQELGEPLELILGDWDQNGVLSLFDIINYRLYLATPYELNNDIIFRADINDDNIISLVDLVSARKLLVGLPIN